MNTQIKAVAYCRVSSAGQQKAGSGLDRQSETIEAFASQSNYKLVKVYRETFTGTETERPIFEDMIVDLLDNGCRVIIVECLDRLARSGVLDWGRLALGGCPARFLFRHGRCGCHVTNSPSKSPYTSRIN